MKTNISALMNLISQKERYLSDLTFSIREHSFNTIIKELDGTTNVVEDNKKDFETELSELEKTTNELTILKGTLYEKNNSFKLSDGRSIQQAIVDNTNLRTLKSCYQVLLKNKNTTKRVSEVNNSYFEYKILNISIDDIKSKIKELDKKIQSTDFEISKLNSIEFKINI